MRFQKPLLRVKLLRRYKRFLADVYSKEMDLTFTVHCPNSGSMKGIYENDPEPTAWISPAENAQRQLPYTLEMIETSYGMVGVNTQNPNKIAVEAIQGGKIDALLYYESLKREVRYDENSRIDILLTSPDKPVTYVEVKNVSMRVDDHLSFPDAVTSRGTKHLLGLMRMVDEGHRAVMLYISQRSDCTTFTVAKDIDPLYAETLIKAIDHGVEVLAYGCHVTPEEIRLKDKLKIRL
jgi:sugar fermentation stimulation protein A